ncbi:MAG TPA: ABC transporter substrate-binding protein, partial [Acetobacteraceae bacterium]|nr:ABC transporter substrate-binding protein [Acetobacteraceae bacterium]
TRPLSSGEQVVSTEIIPTSGSSHRIDYVMRKTNAGWKAIDVLLDGSISRVAVQRSDFRSLLNRGGAPALEASLQQKTQTLSRG